jgi:hypothetical protein
MIAQVRMETTCGFAVTFGIASSLDLWRKQEILQIAMVLVGKAFTGKRFRMKICKRVTKAEAI